MASFFLFSVVRFTYSFIVQLPINTGLEFCYFFGENLFGKIRCKQIKFARISELMNRSMGALWWNSQAIIDLIETLCMAA